MEFALIASIISGICLALMVVTDRLMVGDCYQGNSNHAWFVSSLAGSIFGLILTFLVSVAMIVIGMITTHEFFSTFIEMFWWRGFLMILIGATSIQLLLHYFRCFVEEAHSASVAAWLAATPIFVYGGMLLLTLIENTSLIRTIIEPWWILGIALATFGLVTFERLTMGKGNEIGKYRKDLVLMLICNVVYIIGLRQVLGHSTEGRELIEAIALMPYYWIGFGAGIRTLFTQGASGSLKLSWYARIRYFILPILFVEVIGMCVFWFEYLGITELDPTYVSVIIGANVFLVYVINISLGFLRKSLEKHEKDSIQFCKIKLGVSNLPEININPKHISMEVLTILLTGIGIGLATAYGVH